MKKIISLILSTVVLFTLFTGCNSHEKPMDSDKIKIITTIYPIYDWVKELTNEDTTEVSLLLDSGVDLHSYQPTAADILEISSSDMFIYVGGESDSWVEDIIKSANNSSLVVINLMDLLGDKLKEEEYVEGMEQDNHDHDGEDGQHPHSEEYDEHIWLSVKNAQIICKNIVDSLIEISPDYKEDLTNNLNVYNTKLLELDTKYSSEIAKANNNTILVGDRFPFRYLVDDYNIDYYAAFVGCSAETEASFETIAFLSSKIDELQLEYIITLKGSDQKIAGTIISNTNNKDQDILIMDSIQSVTKEDIDNGVSYISIMENNLDILIQVLN